jgi:hypothetical protein
MERMLRVCLIEGCGTIGCTKEDGSKQSCDIVNDFCGVECDGNCPPEGSRESHTLCLNCFEKAMKKSKYRELQGLA